MSSTNKKWHDKNKMPVHATLEEKGQWFVEHEKNCRCLPSVSKMLKKFSSLRNGS